MTGVISLRLRAIAWFLVALFALGTILAYHWTALALVALGAGWLVRRARRRWKLRGPQPVPLTLQQWSSLTYGQFERAVAGALEVAFGWRCQVTGCPGDNGVDIVGWKPDGTKVVVQCKRWGPRSSIGSPVIQQLIGSRTIYGTDHAWCVTTADFTHAARQLANSQGVVLVSGRALVKLGQKADSALQDLA